MTRAVSRWPPRRHGIDSSVWNSSGWARKIGNSGVSDGSPAIEAACPA